MRRDVGARERRGEAEAGEGGLEVRGLLDGEHQAAERLARQRRVAGAAAGDRAGDQPLEHEHDVRHGLLIPFLALWGAGYGWGMREYAPRSGWPLLIAGVTVFAVRLALYLA